MSQKILLFFIFGALSVAQGKSLDNGKSCQKDLKSPKASWVGMNSSTIRLNASDKDHGVAAVIGITQGNRPVSIYNKTLHSAPKLKHFFDNYVGRNLTMRTKAKGTLSKKIYVGEGKDRLKELIVSDECGHSVTLTLTSL